VTAAPPITLRTEVRPDDIQRARDIAVATGFFRPDEVEIAAELFEERLARGDASEYFFVIADDERGDMLAFANYGPIACTIGSFDLYWIAVHPTAQGRGLGKRLLTEAESRIRAAGGRRIYIETSSQPKYEPTRAFYTACAYTLEATLPDFYAPGDAKLVYAKSV